MSSDMDIEKNSAVETRDVAEDLNSSAEDEKTILEPSEERRLVKSVELTKKMKKGDTYYVVESVWFKKWKDYVNYNEYTSNDGSLRPGQIENGTLLDESNQLKKTVHERWEYEVICEDSWKLLFKWYGGGPAIPRSVIASRSEYNLVVEVRPLTLKMVRSSDPQKTEYLAYYSRVDTVGKLKGDMAAKFNLEPEKFRLWDYHASRKIKMLTVSSEKLEDAQIIDFQLVLIEEQVDGKWPPDPTPSYYSNSYSSYSQPPSHPGLVGLNNLGNTCFMNSALQCLSNTVPLVDFFLSDRFKEDVNETNPLGTGGQLTEEFSKLLKDIWQGNSNMVAPREFKYKLERFAPQFQGYNQHDSQELLAFLLDGLHEDLNRIKKKPYVATIEADGRPDSEVAEESWKGHRSRNDSFIVDWFQAQLKSTLICPIETCKKVSVTFDPFMYLSLPLPIKNTRIISFTLVYLDNARLPVKYHVKVNKFASINELKAGISELVEHKIQPENIVLTDVYGNRFFKEFKDTVDSIQDRDVVVGFEILPQIPKPAEGETSEQPEIVYLPLLNRKEEVYTFTQYSSSTYVSKPLFSNPQVLSLQKKVTARQVYAAVQNKLSRFIKKDVEPENQDPNINPYFVVRVVRKSGYSEEEVDLPLNDDVVELHDRQTLVAFWTTWAVANAYNAAAEKEVEEHSSCALSEESEESTLSLQTSFDLFTVQEQLGPDDPWYCNQCKEHRQAYKKFDIWTLPPILVIHLKRFSYKNRYFRDKIESLVNFPINGLDFSQHVLGGDKSVPALYDLYAISNHYGSLGGGHYTAFAKNKGTNKWYRFDDSSVSEVNESAIVTPAAYILFYIRRDVAEQFKQQAAAAAAAAAAASTATTSSTSVSETTSTTTATTTTTTTPNVTTPAAAADA